MAELFCVGDIFADKYRIESILGKGGMGVVLGARHLGLDEPVAIKVLLPEMLEVRGMVERFVSEARAISKIKSEHVVKVMDIDTLKSGIPYMVMELLDGIDLSALCKPGTKVPVAEAVGYIVEACEALFEAHAMGIIHRDLKPGNLFLARRRDGTSTIKVLDFGISKVGREISGPHHFTTAIGTALGSPAYMSPEQMASARDVDGRTDIWALGAILYRLLAGVQPFRADTTAHLIKLVRTAEPVSLTRHRSDLPPELSAAIQHCLEKERDKRFSTVRELVEALAPFVDESSAAAQTAEALLSAPREQPSLPAGPESISPFAEPGKAMQPLPPPPPMMRGRSWRGVLTAAGALLLLGGIVGVTLRWRTKAPVSAAETTSPPAASMTETAKDASHAASAAPSARAGGAQR